ncbi:MAG TPA: sugar-binding protein, partial [Thermoanaerobaculia bacterium]
MIALLLAATIAVAPPTVEVRKATSPIHIDATLDEPAWAEATAVPIAHEWFPTDNVAAAVETEVFVTYDERNLYVAFRAHDPKPQLIRARHHERDSGSEDDTVGFLIDPYNDDRLAYQFRINPLGVQLDAINSDVEASEDFAWDAIWDAAARLTPDGYIVEVAVPLQQLRIPSRSGPQTWGFMAMRDYPRDVRHRMRSVKTDQNRDCLVCQFADMHGFETGSGGRNLEVTPTITGTNDDAFDAGVSARWAVTPGTSLQATINPDFSQVEADAAQLDVNTRFALFFPEKRPFFVEGADYFETRLPLVFTRTIADPAGGLKVTGKSGPHLYGALLARDEVTNILIPGDQSDDLVTLNESSTSMFARYRRELGGSATIGGLVSARRGEDYENTVVAADSLYRFTQSDSVRVQLAGSRTEYPDALAAALGQQQGAFEGHAIHATYGHSDRNWSWGSQYNELSPEFRADSGFINQVGVRSGSAYAERRVRGGPDTWFRNIYFSVGADSTQQYEGNWTEWGADIGATYQGPRQSELSFNLAPNQEYYAGTTYHNFRWSAFGSIQATPDVALSLEVRGGEQIDFNNAQQADTLTLSPAATLNIGRRMSGQLSYDYQVFETKSGEHIFDVHLPQARLLYHFNRRSYVRTIIQYEKVDFAGEKEDNLLTQFLFSYRVNAQTVFLAGYSDTSNDEGSVFVKVG